MATQTPNKTLTEVLFLLIEDPDKYSYHLSSDNWLKIYEKDQPENLIYIDTGQDFIYDFFKEIGVNKPL